MHLLMLCEHTFVALEISFKSRFISFVSAHIQIIDATIVRGFLPVSKMSDMLSSMILLLRRNFLIFSVEIFSRSVNCVMSA
ncbi:hypothetical protein AR158_c143R [Paramecium bursaria Chlorella virus AR158]|uniref:hypothetical protein n=1 Tax=Paramecium bursaria Chlorella virus AR158 TaxID=380598 RepID=UPI00015AA7EE|nr:hypothetical protein AR158_c143R [Paramecium bursaria Chlorella virus AR158]ABU43689.1 hypothetical protein AR158_c143R [Paramecium bursaria Chlorella virus AR158]